MRPLDFIALCCWWVIVLLFYIAIRLTELIRFLKRPKPSSKNVESVLRRQFSTNGVHVFKEDVNASDHNGR
jgi:hypothetical protein